MIKAAIFDFDGTLVDSMPFWENIGKNYLLSLGKTPREDLRKTFKTFTLEQSAAYYQKHYDVKFTAEEIIEGVNRMVESFYRQTAALKPGVKGFLERLEEKGISMCVATVTEGSLVEAALDRLGIRPYFCGVLSCAHTGHNKEEPYIYRQAAALLGREKNQTVVFEDVIHALQTAKKDGFLTAAVYDPYEERQREMREMADFYIRDFSDAGVFLKALYI